MKPSKPPPCAAATLIWSMFWPEQDTAAPADADTIPLTPAGEQADDGSTPATLDRAYLESLSFAELKRLANDMDVPVTKTTKKAELIDTLAAETVTVPAEADDTEPDFWGGLTHARTSLDNPGAGA